MQNDLLIPEEIRCFLEPIAHLGFTLAKDEIAHRQVSGWMGSRWFLCHASLLRPHTRFATIVCSRLGRRRQHVPRWPQLLELAIRDMKSNDFRLLFHPETTLGAASQEFADRAGVPNVEVKLSQPKQKLVNWIKDCSEQIDDSTDPSRLLFVSPVLGSEPARAAEPLRDTALIGLADRVFGLSIRKGGNLESLIERRISEQRSKHFSVGSVFLAIDESKPKELEKVQDWMDRGAVGWHVLDSDKTLSSDSSCAFHCKNRKHQGTHQFCLSLATFETGAKRSTEWLAHCTRTSSSSEQVADAMHRGRTAVASPWISLKQICAQERLVASSRLTQGEQRCVSFSAVGLEELLSRRVFRSHLGRWDWEPYGLLIRRSALEEIGCRPVIYGEPNERNNMAAAEKPFFQSRGKTMDWTQEQEWRLIGDLDLNKLERNDVRIFAETRDRAYHLARSHPWTAIWVHDP